MAFQDSDAKGIYHTNWLGAVGYKADETEVYLKFDFLIYVNEIEKKPLRMVAELPLNVAVQMKVGGGGSSGGVTFIAQNK